MAGAMSCSWTATSSTTTASSGRSTSPRLPPGRPSSTSWRLSPRSSPWSLSPALMKGYGKDPSVNGILASFWGLASDRQWAPDFHRVPSESNVSDAISRGDDSRARAEGWTRVTTPVEDIMDVLARAASDIDFACHVAPERLLDLAVW